VLDACCHFALLFGLSRTQTDEVRHGQPPRAAEDETLATSVTIHGRGWQWSVNREMVTAPDGTGHPTFCPEPPVLRARTQIDRGKWYVVDSCNGHVDNELVGAKRLSNQASGL
jgi:hypothetical protein